MFPHITIVQRLMLIKKTQNVYNFFLIPCYFQLNKSSLFECHITVYTFCVEFLVIISKIACVFNELFKFFRKTLVLGIFYLIC